MSIRTKILAPLLSLIVLAALVCGLVGQQSFAAHRDLAQVAASAVAAADASRLARDSFDRSDRVVTQVVAMTDFTSEDSIRQRFDAAGADTASNLASLRNAAQSPAMRTLAQGASDRFEDWRAAAEVLLGLRKAKEITTIDVLNSRGETLRTALNQAVSSAGHDALTRMDEVGASLRSRMIALFVGSGAVAIAALVFAVRLSLSLSRPLVKLVASAQRLADGDVSVEIADVDRRDEIGAISRAVAVFRGNVTAQLEAVAQADRQRRSADDERAANEAARGTVQHQQATMVAAIASGLDRLSCGDLTNRLEGAFAPEYEKLRTDFNTTAASLKDAIGTISDATDGIGRGSDQIALAADDLSRRTEQQAASLEQTAATLNVITDMVRKMAVSAGAAASIVVTTRDAAEASGLVVRDAIDAMGKIKRSSDQISTIISVIDEIAFQTNLLALNAGVEAARAGDSGRGFAVVASEVRGLAQRSAEAAKEIRALISASTTQVESGVGLVGETGEALKGIIAHVADMEGLMRGMSDNAREQANGIAEVNIAVNQMNQGVQQNAAMVEESTAAAHALKSETQSLTEMVGRFHTGARAEHAGRGHNNPASQAKLRQVAWRKAG